MTAAVPATAFVAHWSRPARLRSAANDLAIGLPLPLAAAALAARAGGWPTALAVVVAGLALVAMVAHARSRRSWCLAATPRRRRVCCVRRRR
jgi:hypothetical protein